MVISEVLYEEWTM